MGNDDFDELVPVVAWVTGAVIAALGAVGLGTWALVVGLRRHIHGS